MRICEKCRDENTWPVETVMMPGNIVASLCNPCHRAFVLLLKRTELKDREARLTAKGLHYDDQAHAGLPVFESDRLALELDNNALELELAEASIAWLGTLGEIKPETSLPPENAA